MKIVTLTLNPAFDVHCRMAQFLPYHENLAEITDRDAGGKGVNISRALTANGTENLAFLVLGEENGADFCRLLDADSVKYTALTVPGRIRENITLHPDNASETRISFSGFSTDNALVERVKSALIPCVDGDTLLTFTGRIPKGMCADTVKSMLRAFTEMGAKIVIDSKSFTLSDLVELKPWLIKPNQEEIGEYLEKAVDSFEDALDSAKELHAKGIKNVMISLGASGALLVCTDGAFKAVPPKIEAVSTIGAGDSSIAGFLAAAKDGKSAPEMLRTAVAYGTAACLSAGTRPPTLKDISRIFEKVSVTKI